MTADRADLLQGTLDLLVLKALAGGPLHGLGVSRRIGLATRGAFDVKPGSLFPALNRLEENGWVTASWGRSENNRRARFYRLTGSGRAALRAEVESWRRFAAAIELVLSATTP